MPAICSNWRANSSLTQHTMPALRHGSARPGWARSPGTRLARHAHAKQYRRLQREIRELRTWLGRVIGDVQRKGGEIAGALKARLEIAQRLHAQRRDSKNKLWALHAAEVKCLAGGKARTPYECGVGPGVPSPPMMAWWWTCDPCPGCCAAPGTSSRSSWRTRGCICRPVWACSHRRNDAADAIAPSGTSC